MSILDYTPTFYPDDATKFAQTLYSLKVSAKSLPSERDQNFLLTIDDDERFILKIANATENRAILEAQNEVMSHLAQRISFCPHVIKTSAGDEISSVNSQDGKTHFVRLVTYLPGTPLGDVKRHSDKLLHDLGQKIGQLTNALADFDHTAFHRDFHWDLANGLNIIQKNNRLIAHKTLRKTVLKLVFEFEEHTAPMLPNLPRSIIYNDANDFNLIVGGGDSPYTKNQSIVGLIDFGDMVYSYTIADLAVAIAYAILGKPDPLATAAQIVQGYHSVHPLSEDELTALFGFVIMRLCMSVCIAAEQQANRPENAYLSISQTSIFETLPKLTDIHPRFAEAAFREACDLPPFPGSNKIVNWLADHTDTFASPLALNLRIEPIHILDLSISSPLLDSDPAKNKEPYLTPRIEAAIAASDAQVGIGRYNEARYFYVDPAFATGKLITDEYRTIHLGIDLFVPVGTPVYAPLAGTVVSFNDNNSPKDYGPGIVLKHESNEHPTFYTLYGHLNRKSLNGIKLGQRIEKGERLAAFGESEANGRWTPHLHFQIIIDLLELGTDFPSVANPSQRGIWLSLCPDPNLILGIPSKNFPPREPDKGKTLAKRHQHLGRNLSISYQKPLKILRGWKQYLFDYEGHKYLDAYNNVVHVGHNHPRVVAAARQQIGVLNTNTRYLHDNIIRYADKLISLLPESLSVCYFVNSGSEANELALRLARIYTGQRDMIVLEAAYHGNTTTMIDISPYKHNGPGGKGTPDWVHIAPIPDDFRGAYKRDDPNAGAKYACHVLEISEKLKADGCGLAGFIAESLPSVGGQIVPPPGYLADVYHYVHDAGGLCIADEVQTGLGRIGTHFWGFEMQDVTPDIVVLGKPIGNGHPLGAVVTTPEIAEAFANGMEYFNTFGGNPVSCAVGLEVLNVVLEENLQAHALRVGERMLSDLRPFVKRFPIVGDMRGSGLFLGVELVRDRETLEPATQEADYVMNRMREHGILLGTDGPYHNVIKIRPPMPFDEENAEFLVEIMEKVLSELD
ncbi:MAG: aminotransferase class III-fold pyridoxal phosphate-dependent enzyme [Anaerolineales bacterium]|jgi:4-aminobutyrate aminotransferase-like enzyme/Ser/Thr protein kinase RdoA (MazF antagonist)